MKIHFLGTCSGTEPLAGRHHTSLIMECNDAYYWFDAGEGCAHRSHTDPRLNPRKTRAIFISHTDIDHIGGLPNLLFALDKTGVRCQLPLTKGDTTVDVYFPDDAVWQAIQTIYPLSTGRPYSLKVDKHRITDGEIYHDDNVRIVAAHNAHLGTPNNQDWKSFSFAVFTDKEKVVYSGDVKSITELDSLVGETCDLLIMETGHHAVADVCDYAAKMGIKMLCFCHHGREILENFETVQSYVERFSKEHHLPIYLSDDGMTVALGNEE